MESTKTNGFINENNAIPDLVRDFQRLSNLYIILDLERILKMKSISVD